MDIVDALGERPERRASFTRDMLAETNDEELQRIVVRAAAELDTPIALVSLVLDDIQFFKAHHGLPDDLAAARGMHRGASFCQFVVRDGTTIKIEDAAADERLPQMIVKDYDIRSYLGVPISSGDAILGSLCVIDTKARSFGDDDKEKLEELAVGVNRRLRDLASRRQAVRQELSVQAGQDVIDEVKRSLEPMRHAVAEGLPTIAAVRSLFRLTEHVADGGDATPHALKYALEAAEHALSRNEEVLYGIQAAVADCDDGLRALDSLSEGSAKPRLSLVLEAAQDIARSTTRLAGGTVLPNLSKDPVLSAPKPLAVAIVATAMTQVAQHLASLQSNERIRMRVEHLESARLALTLKAPSARRDAVTSIVEQLHGKLGSDPSISIVERAGSVCVVLHTLDEDSEEPG